jgi:N utilization substance protein B
LAVRLVYTLAENPADAKTTLEETLDAEYYATLADEDELYKLRPTGDALNYLERVVTGVSEHLAELDSYIEKHAVGWQFYRISRTAVSIMRVAMFEALYMPDIPRAAAMNEAIELAKKYDTPETVSFTNGVLGAFTKTEIPDAGK